MEALVSVPLHYEPVAKTDISGPVVDMQNSIDTDFWYYSFRNKPLMKRAWVVQELFLAPRVLHLNKMEMFWECYGLAACESYPHGLPPMTRERGISRNTIRTALSNGGSHSAFAEKSLSNGVSNGIL
jgi:hypothetical protein